MNTVTQPDLQEMDASLVDIASFNGVERLEASGLVETLEPRGFDDFLTGTGLRVLFFTGGEKRRRESHDVAIALRELLKDYRGQPLAGAIIESAAEEQKGRFRIVVEPSLAIALNGEPLEVLPGVRDWADYAAAFARYLGAPERRMNHE